MPLFFKHKRIEEPHASTTEKRAHLSKIARSHVKELAGVLFVAVALLLSIAWFNSYLDRMFFTEGSQHLATTYKQVAGTFKLFAHRNWSLLDDWENSLDYITDPAGFDTAMERYKKLKKTWGYSEFYLFNESNSYLAASGRTGTADSIASAFTEMYKKNKPTVSSYIASNGRRKIVFAQPLQERVEVDGVTYTGVGISYDNEFVEDVVTSAIATDASDCYVARKDGSVVLSLEPKAVFTEYMPNIKNFLKSQTAFKIGSPAKLERALKKNATASALVSYQGSSYYVISQPAGLFDWSIVCVVKASSVDSSLYRVRNVTTIAQAILSVVLLLGGGAIIVGKSRERVTRESQERQKAVHEQDMALQLLHGMAETADRYAVADLVAGTYEYHERLLDTKLYKEHGAYADLVAAMSNRYTALTDDDNAKIDRLICADALKAHLKSGNDRIKFEYAARSEAVYMLMTVVPLEFNDDGELTRAMLIGQDIGLRKELESAANTDNLTGIFNERYFTRILTIKEFKRIPFTLFFLDLDRFKPVNDTYGHEMGDRLLKQVGARLQACVRANDFAFRIGGDEFALIVTDGMSDRDCERMRERVEDQIRAPYAIDDLELTIGVSCGYASWPDDSPSIAGVRVLADSRMYEEKSAHHVEYGEAR